MRLRQSRCAREGCESHLYKLTFLNDRNVDWAKLFTLAKSCEQPAQTEPVEETMDEGKPATPLRMVVPRTRTLVRAGALAAGLIVTFVVHQLYFGGKIPFVREPRNFRMTVSSNGKDSHTDKAPAKDPVKGTSARYTGGSDDK